jgi:orotate phosphoribosyltransferase
MAVAEEAGATVVAAGAIIDRSGGAAELGVPFSALASLSLPTFPPDDCPMCRAGTAAVKPGSRSQPP